MKPRLRLLLRLLAALIALLAVGALVTVDGVDHRPYFEQPYHAETTARLRGSATAVTTARGPLAAGFGRARLTPTINAAADDPARGVFRALPLAGYGNRRGLPATGVHDDLYVKAVALRAGGRVGVMVGTDALIVPPEVTDLAVARLERECGLTRGQVYLSATHTHCSLGGWGAGFVAESFAGGFQPGSRVWFAECIVAAVRDALADLRPAEFGHGRFAAPEYIRNRLVGPLGRVDPEFSYAIFRQRGGRLAVLGTYGAHATVLSGKTMTFSADYPGRWQRAVEEATGGAAIFLAGAVGSHGPVAGAKDFAGVDRMGRALAEHVVQRLPGTPLADTVTFGLLGLEVSLPPLNVRLTDGVRVRPWLARHLLPVRPHSFMQIFRLEDSLWISTPCDFSGELALPIKDAFRVRGFAATITSFNGDYVGYVIPSRYYHLSGYEPRTMSFFGPNVPNYFDELIRSMGEALIAAPAARTQPPVPVSAGGGRR